MANAGQNEEKSIRPAAQQLTAAERLDWLRLVRSQNVGPATFHELISHCGSAGAALDALPELAQRGGRARRITVCPSEQAEVELHEADRSGAQVVTLYETGYPPWLAQIHAPPPVILMKGDISLAQRPIVAIVGARNGSAIGQKLARQLAIDLGRQGYVIDSGLSPEASIPRLIVARWTAAQLLYWRAVSTISTRRKTPNCTRPLERTGY